MNNMNIDFPSVTIREITFNDVKRLYLIMMILFYLLAVIMRERAVL